MPEASNALKASCPLKRNWPTENAFSATRSGRPSAWGGVAGVADDGLLAGFAGDDSESAVAFVRRFQHRVFGLARTIVGDAAVAEDPTIALRAGALAAQRDTVIDRESLEWLSRDAPPLGRQWNADGPISQENH